MAGTLKYTEDWQALPWSEIERTVYRLQQRIYQAASCGDVKRGLRLRATDVLEVHHRDGNHHNHHYLNLALIHGHCHDFVHRSKVLMTTAA